MTNNEQFYFLGRCLALGENEIITHEVISIIEQDKADWNHFVSLASNHLVLPAVYLQFKRHNILPYLPEELVGHLRMVYELNCQRNKTILEQIDKINRLFATKGIVPIYLKGTGNLLDHLYEDIGERMIGDIDLLVSDDEFIPAANLLLGEGYETNYPFHLEEYVFYKHYPRLVHPTELADVEVHRFPVEIHLSANFNYTIVNPEKKQIDTNPCCYVLSDNHKVVLNFFHGFMASDVKFMHNSTFRNMYDLFLLSHRVDIYKAFANQPQYEKKAIVYADFMFYALGILNQHTPSLESKVFIKKQESLRDLIFLYRINWTLKYVASRFWKGYICNLAGIFYSKLIRKSVFRRLSDPQWYKYHIKSYADSFKKNIGGNKH
jgi:hypothetical protein